MMNLFNLKGLLISGVAAFVIGGGAATWITAKIYQGRIDRDRLILSEVFRLETIRQTNIALEQTRKANELSNRWNARNAAAQRTIEIRTRTITKEIERLITPEIDNITPITWSLVSVHDLAASAPGTEFADISGITSRPPNEASDVKLSEVAAVLRDNYAACYANAEQLVSLQGWALDVTKWYNDVSTQLRSVKSK